MTRRSFPCGAMFDMDLSTMKPEDRMSERYQSQLSVIAEEYHDAYCDCESAKANRAAREVMDGAQ